MPTRTRAVKEVQLILMQLLPKTARNSNSNSNSSAEAAHSHTTRSRHRSRLHDRLSRGAHVTTPCAPTAESSLSRAILPHSTRARHPSTLLVLPTAKGRVSHRRADASCTTTQHAMLAHMRGAIRRRAGLRHEAPGGHERPFRSALHHPTPAPCEPLEQSARTSRPRNPTGTRN